MTCVIDTSMHLSGKRCENTASARLFIPHAAAADALMLQRYGTCARRGSALILDADDDETDEAVSEQADTIEGQMMESECH